MTQVYTTPLAVAQHCYDLFAKGDVETLVNDFLSPEVVWTEPATLPEGGTHTSPQEILQNVFGPFQQNWGADAAVTPSQWICEGNNVVAIGSFAGTNNGEPYSIPFCHVMTIDNGRLTRFTNYTDTASALAIIDA